MFRTSALAVVVAMVAGCAISHLAPPGDAGRAPDARELPRDLAVAPLDLAVDSDAGEAPSDLGVDADTPPPDAGADAGVPFVGDCLGSPSTFVIAGDSDDWISGGAVTVGTPFDCGGDGEVSCRARDSAGQFWFFDFRSRTPGTSLASGDYVGGLAVSGAGRGCSMLTTGHFTVQELTRDASAPGSVVRFRATFEQYCDGSPARAVGCISYTAP